MLDQRMADYWQEVHSRGYLGELRAALTGAHLADHVDALQVQDRVTKDSKILCIGVGLGGWVWELAGLGCDISALDIAPSALDRVKQFAKTFLPTDKLPINTFDLALSHWVTPHMTPIALQEQLNNVIPSLKNTGIFAMQFSEPDNWPNGVDPRSSRKTDEQKLRAARSVFKRTDIADMVNKAGGKILCIAKEYKVSTHFINIVMVHITRK